MSHIASRAAGLLSSPLPVTTTALSTAASPLGAAPASPEATSNDPIAPATALTDAAADVAVTGAAAAPESGDASTPANSAPAPVDVNAAAAAQTAAAAFHAPTTTTAQLVTPAAFPAPPAAGGGIGGAVTALVVVVALILALAWLAKRMPVLGGGAGSNPALRVVSSLALGPRERLVVVAVGDTQLLLGVGAGGTRTLHTLDQPLPVGTAATPAFAQLLAQHFGRKG